MALALTELFIAGRSGSGACRVHGGGFAGVIMAMLPNDLVDEYVAYIEKALGEGNAYRMSIRPYGAVCVNELSEVSISLRKNTAVRPSSPWRKMT